MVGNELRGCGGQKKEPPKDPLAKPLGICECALLWERGLHGCHEVEDFEMRRDSWIFGGGGWNPVRRVLLREGQANRTGGGLTAGEREEIPAATGRGQEQRQDPPAELPEAG